jgi:glycosyltransferase involved in cell wall biosynthesis
LETLVDAAAILAKDPNLRPWRILIVGDGMSREIVERQIINYGLEDYILLEGLHPKSDMPKYYEIADVLYASLSSSPLFKIMIPLKIQAYMAVGKPVLASIAGEGAEVITASGCGLVSPPGNAVALAFQLKQLITMAPDSLAEMGQNGFRYFLENFEHERIMDRIEAELSQALSISIQ